MDTKVTVSLGERGADRARLEVLHRQVREELHQVDDLDVASLGSPAGSTPAPEGTRGARSRRDQRPLGGDPRVGRPDGAVRVAA